MNVSFTFSRFPSTKVSIQIEVIGLVPADNDVVLVGRRISPKAQVFTCQAVADSSGSLDGAYFLFSTPSTDYYVWIDVDNGSSDPAVAGRTGIEVDIATDATADTVAAAIQAAVDAVSGVSASVVTDTVTITAGATGDADDPVDGSVPTGFTLTVTVDGVDGGSVAAGTLVALENVADIDALQTEVDGKFGAGSALAEMAIAAAKGVQNSSLDPVATPPMSALVMEEADTDLAAALAAKATVPMPYLVSEFDGTDATNRASLKAHAELISRSDRGQNGQFGTFSYSGLDDDLATVQPIGEGTASPNVLFPWLRDTAVSKANAIYEVAAGLGALNAANGIPFNPMNGIRVGGLAAPSDLADHHTPGDAGSAALGLESGVLPLMVNPGSEVEISRLVTSSRRVASVADSAYYDQPDWATLYFLRKQFFNLTQQKRYKIAKASLNKAQNLKSELLGIMKTLEGLEMLQSVDALAELIQFQRDPTNRHAFIFEVYANVIPGFHNKGIGIIGTNRFDLGAI